METTKLTVEYLIIGILVSIAAIFLLFNIAPIQMQTMWNTLLQYPSMTSTGIIVMISPIFYGVGIVAEYLGMLAFDGYLDKIKEERFSNYVSRNRNWLGKSRLLSTFAKKEKAIPKGSGKQMYGEMRFFVLMNNSFLFGEIKAQIDRYRIIRVLIIAEILFIIGFLVHFAVIGIDPLSASLIITIIILLLITIRAMFDRYNRYCRAIEHSFKALSLDEFNPKLRNNP